MAIAKAVIGTRLWNSPAVGAPSRRTAEFQESTATTAPKITTYASAGPAAVRSWPDGVDSHPAIVTSSVMATTVTLPSVALSAVKRSGLHPGNSRAPSV